ncbi:MAG: LLM class F420-dependent oxidoreductase [Actinomycetota bacterium]|nr:LLM class F420-dependent oxidoreductase [Actinomycetota bacterium]
MTTTPARRSVVAPLWLDRPPAENVDVAVTADRLGYDELWVGEMTTFDAFALATAIGARTDRLTLTVGPLAVAVRTPVTLAMGVASVAELTGRPVRLALGTSSDVIVEQWHGRAQQGRARRLEETAVAVRPILDGERSDHAGDVVATRGFQLRLEPPGAHLTVAASGPRAIGVAARRADRMVLNLVTPDAVAASRAALVDAAADAGRAAPEVAVWLPAAVDPSRATLAQLRRGVVAYLAAPGYRDMFTAAGFGDLVEQARAGGHPRDLFAVTPDELVEAVGVVGPAEVAEARIAAYEAAGVDEICLVPATADDPTGARTLDALRPT